MAEKERVTSKPPSPRAAGRKVYRTPKLQEYGHVSKLTQAGGATNTEAGNPRRRMCL